MINLINQRLKDNEIPGRVTMTVNGSIIYVEHYFKCSNNQMNNPDLIKEDLTQWKESIKKTLGAEWIYDEAYYIPIKRDSLRYFDCFTMRIRPEVKEISFTDPNFENSDISFLMKD